MPGFGLKSRIKKWTNFDPKIVGILLDKCRRETAFGRVANLCLKILYLIAVRLKGIRSYLERLKGGSSPAEKAFPLGGDFYTQQILPLKLPKILIVAELSIPQCTRYRIDQKKVAFEALGYEVIVLSFTEHRKCLGQIPFCTAVLFYRTPYWATVKNLIDECRRQSIKTIYDIDDLVFDLNEYAQHPVFKDMPKADVDSFLDGAKSYRDCLAATDSAIASTKTLADYMRKYCKGNVYVVENALDVISLEVADRVRMLPRLGSADKILIGYGSGTKSHDHDFALVSGILAELMRSDSRIHLAIHGYLNLGQEFNGLESRIQKVPFLAVNEYLLAVSQFDVNLAPLAAGAFNDAKSNIKLIEAAALGVPSIISPRKSFLDFVRDGETALVADTAEDWKKALSKLINDKDLRKAVGLSVEKETKAYYSPDKTKERLASIMKDIEVGSPLPIASERRRILLVNCLFAPASFGGATLVVEGLAENLSKEADVAVFTLNQFSQLEEYGMVRYVAKGAQVFSVRFGVERFEKNNWDDVQMADAFSQALLAFKPDVVHFHAIQGIGSDVIKKAKDYSAKVVITMHDAWWVCERQFMLTPAGSWCGQKSIDIRSCVTTCALNSAGAFKRYFNLRSAASSADVILAPSRWHAEIMSSSLGREVRVNKNGVIKPLKEPLNRPHGELVFAFLGGANAAHKGYFVVKEIFERMSRADYRLILVDIHRKLGLSSVKEKSWKINGKLEICDPFDSSSMDQFFSGIDVLLCPTLVPESFGLVTREAVLRKVWVIAMDSGGLAEDLEDGVNSTVVKMGDVKGFEEAIYKAFSQKVHREGLSAPKNILGYDDQARELLNNYY
jgi:glycosyltransferase involved in cell wall biosynthesis